MTLLRNITGRFTAIFGRLIGRSPTQRVLPPLVLPLPPPPLPPPPGTPPPPPASAPSLGAEAPTIAYPGVPMGLRRDTTDGAGVDDEDTATTQSTTHSRTVPADVPPHPTDPSGSPLSDRPVPRGAGESELDEASTDPRLAGRRSAAPSRLSPPPDPLAKTDVQLRHGAAGGLWFNPGATELSTALSTSDVAMQRAIDLLVRGRMVVFDVGAGFGLCTLVAARRCLDGRVIAFEPVPDHGALLERSASRNSWHHVQFERCALGERAGEARMHLSRRPGRGRLDTAGLPPEPAGFLQVQLQTMDQVVAGNVAPPPDLLVVDVEGAEASVLRGAAHVLRAARPIVVLSLHGTGPAITRLLDSFGIEAYALGAGDAVKPGPQHRWAVGFPRERVHLQTYVGPLCHKAIVEPDRVRASGLVKPPG